MSISTVKRNFLKLSFLFTIVCGGGGAAIFHFFMPEQYFQGYPLIPIYFFLFGIGSIYLLEACKRWAPKKVLLTYLAIKIIKLLASIIFLLLYCFIAQAYEKEFLLTFVVFYLLYLIFETWFFFVFEWNQTKRNKKQYETVA